MMERTATVAVSLTLAAMVLSPFAAVAHAEPYYSGQSQGQPDATTFAVCEIRDHTWVAPSRPTPCMGGWGDRISMRQGGAPQISCHTDTSKILDIRCCGIARPGHSTRSRATAKSPV